MKFPQIVSCEDALKQETYDAIIDVRSPAEFAIDHLPGAINLPVLDDAERQEIGTIYKQIGAFEAKRKGAGLVAQNIATHLDRHLAEQPKNWRPLIYCWRGGNRSASMALIFAKIGWPVALLDGGYKSYRQHVLHAMPDKIRQFNWVCLNGPTGSGKTRLLRTLQQQGAQTLDLECLARHRGSLLGNPNQQTQPSQKLFESLLFAQLSKLSPQQVVFVESESAKIGNLRIPLSLLDMMRSARQIQLELSIEQRIQLLKADYAEWLKQPQSLTERLHHFEALVGKAQLNIWLSLLDEGKIDALIQSLLAQHYDPAYSKSARYLAKRQTEVTRVPLQDCDENSLTSSAQQILRQLSLSSII